MSKVLMSIKPEYVNKILSGQKRFEFRKRQCAKEIDTIIIYETAPIQLVVAEVEVVQIIKNSPQQLWEQTKNLAGVEKNFFNQYYYGANIAIAYELGNVTRYDPPRTLEDYGIKKAPQSYVYI
jgi:predicted transcriptional regulator